MPKLISIRDRAGWAIPGFKAGAHTLRLDKELKDWRVHIRGTRVFLVRGTQVEELPRDDVRLTWELAPGETDEAIDGMQKWSSPVAVKVEEKAEPKKEAKR